MAFTWFPATCARPLRRIEADARLVDLCCCSWMLERPPRLASDPGKTLLVAASDCLFVLSKADMADPLSLGWGAQSGKDAGRMPLACRSAGQDVPACCSPPARHKESLDWHGVAASSPPCSAAWLWGFPTWGSPR